MEVIKHGNTDKTYENSIKFVIECWKCGCKYVYDNRDVVHDYREGDSWTHCPECQSTNDHNGLNIYKL